jgi:hypothetical protein
MITARFRAANSALKNDFSEDRRSDMTPWDMTIAARMWS